MKDELKFTLWVFAGMGLVSLLVYLCAGRPSDKQTQPGVAKESSKKPKADDEFIRTHSGKVEELQKDSYQLIAEAHDKLNHKTTLDLSPELAAKVGDMNLL